MSQTIDQVYSDYNVQGVPASGEKKPSKAEIRALLKMIQNSGGQAVTRNTLSALNGVTPPNENYMGIVLTGSGAGYYYRSGGAWVFGRGFPDSVAVWTQTGGTGAAYQVAISAGVDPSGVALAVFTPTDTNSAGATVNVNGVVRPILSATGAPIAAGELLAGRAAILVNAADGWRVVSSQSRMTFRGAWDSGTAYDRDDLTENSGSIWLAKRPNTGVTPVEGDDWTLFMPGVSVADGSITDTKLSSSLKNVIVGVAANRAALAAMNGSNYLAVDLMEAGRKGIFHWQSGDLSAQVTTDTQQGIYVAPASDATGASGAWVRRFDGKVWPKWFGAVADGVADDTLALRGVFSPNLPIEWGGEGNVYRITDGIEHTATRNVNWHSSGARILVDPPGDNIQYALKIHLDGNHISTEGQLWINGNNKTFMGAWIRNAGNPNVNASIYGLNVENIYRNSLAFEEGGDGVYLWGGFLKVVVSDFTIKNVKMATGAGVAFLQGVSGLTIFRRNLSNDHDIALVENFNIENVYSEDVSYGMRDQDGIRITQSYTKTEVAVSGTNPSTAMVSKGRLKNCHGRAVKMVSEYGLISDLMIVRNKEIYDNFKPSASEDIDFQVGGGTIRGVRCYYNNNCPESFVSFNTIHADGRRTPSQCVVDDVVISQMDSTRVITRLVDIHQQFAPAGPGMVKVNVSDVQVSGVSSDISEIVRLNNTNDISSGLIWSVSLINVMARIGQAFIWREHASIATEVQASGFSVFNSRPATVPLASGTVLTTGITSVLGGANQRVS